MSALIKLAASAAEAFLVASREASRISASRDTATRRLLSIVRRRAARLVESMRGRMRLMNVAVEGVRVLTKWSRRAMELEIMSSVSAAIEAGVMPEKVGGGSGRV